MAYTPQTWADGDPTRPLSAARMSTLESGVSAASSRADAAYTLAQGGGGSNPLHVVPLSSFAGSDDTTRFRNMLTAMAGQSRKPAVAITPGATLDAGTTPFVIPAGLQLIGAESVETEFGYSCPVNLRHTGATNNATKGVFQTSPRGTNDNGGKGWSMSRLSFLGTASTKAWVDNPLDASGSIWAYSILDNVSWNQFQSIASTPMLGVQITGTTYMNNVGSSTEPPWRLGGSDNNLFTDGGFFELGGVGTGTPNGYPSRVLLPAMIDCGALSKTRFGPVYITGSPTTPFRLTGGEGGVALADMTLEGRPVVGTAQLWCAGALVRLQGGGMVIRNKWHGFAMRAPQDKAAGGLPLDQGFYHITGGDHYIDGGTFQPYTAATYGGTVPPFIYITGGTVNVKGITLGPNAGGVKPVVKYASLANIKDSDNSVTLSQI